MSSPPAMIETMRLLLRPPTVADAEAIFADYAQDPSVTRYLSWRPHQEVGTVEAFLREGIEVQKSGSRQLWVITVNEADRAVGMIEARVREHRMNLGYVLARRYWGNGYMAEALRPLVDWGLGQDHIYRVWAFSDVDNRASARVLEKIGMQREGILRRWSVHPNVSEAPRDCYCYSVVKGDA